MEHEVNVQKCNKILMIIYKEGFLGIIGKLAEMNAGETVI